ncbi:MAG: hypothetical protein IPI66_12895 [Chitinophagaceae bacterium]|nr:hypothetical protein [Chitinophagaceae bacterium]
MNKHLLYLSAGLLGLILNTACKSPVKERNDEIYSRHLQKHVKLSIISTPMPDDKSEMNLLLLNDGQDLGKFRVKEILDSLYRKKAIQPLLVIGIHAGDRMREYGVAGLPDYKNNGDKADHYSGFIDDELYPFAKKKATVRKFRSVVMAGCSLGGLSAFDIAWDHADKIDKVGVFSGSFWWRDKDANAAGYSDDVNRIMISKIRSSKKKPHLQYWFSAGGKEENGDRDKDGITDVVDDTRDLVTLIKNKNVCSPDDIRLIEDPNGRHDYADWSNQLPAFLVWAFGK